MHVFYAFNLSAHSRHFVEVGGKKTKRIYGCVKVLADTPSDSESLTSACTPA